MISDAITRYFAGLDSRHSNAAGVIEVARMGARIQRGRDPEAMLSRWEPSPMRGCSPAHLMVLRAVYWPDHPRLTWHDGQQVARESSDEEVAAELGLDAETVRRLRAEAETIVGDALERAEREHRSKCE